MSESTSVVIVNWNNAPLTLRAVNSVLNSRTARSIDVVVVDNGSDDADVRMLESEPRISLVRLPQNRGFGAGANAGIAHTSGRHVILLNNDAVVEEDFVESILSRLENGTDSVGAVTAHVQLSARYTRSPAKTAPSSTHAPLVGLGGERWYRTESDGGNVLVNSTGNVLTRSGNGQDRHWLAPAPIEAPERVFGFSGGAAALNRQALDQVGCFDESLFMYYEDTELSWRLRRRGWEIVYCSEAVAWHDHAASSGTGSAMFLYHNARNRLLVAIWHGPTRMALYASLATLVRLARLTRSWRSEERRAVWRATRDVAATLGGQVRKRRMLAEGSLRAGAVRAALRK